MTNAAELVISDFDFDLMPSEHYIERFELALSQALTTAHSMSISDNASFDSASILFKRAKEVRDKIDAWRKEATAPLRDKTAAINDRAREFTDPLKDVEAIIKMKMDAYHKQVESARQLEAAAIREAEELFGVGPTTFTGTKSDSIKGSGASVSTKEVKEWRLSDFSQVPMEFLMLNESAIEQAIKDGRIIPGIEIYKTQKTTIRKR